MPFVEAIWLALAQIRVQKLKSFFTLLGVTIAVSGSLLIYGLLKKTLGLRLDPEEEFNGADLSIHRISASPERETNW